MPREAEKLLESTRANARDSENSGASQEQDDDRIVDRDETDPYNEVIFGRRRPDSVAIEWTSKTVYVLEFKRTSDQRQDDGTFATNSTEAIYAINCFDSPSSATEEEVKQLAKDWVKDAPIFGDYLAWGNLACTIWPVKDPNPINK